MNSDSARTLSDTQLRFERLFAVQDAELDIALRVHGMHPEMLSVKPEPHEMSPDVLKDIFASLSIPSAARGCDSQHKHTEERETSSERSSRDVTLPNDVLCAVLAHPPRSLYWQESLPDTLQKYRGQQSSKFAMSHEASKLNPVDFARSQEPHAYLLSNALMRVSNSNPGESEEPSDVDFSESFTRDSNAKLGRVDRKRFREEGLADLHKSRRGVNGQRKVDISAQADADDTDIAMSGNPYCVAFNALQRESTCDVGDETVSKTRERCARGSFRTAASKLLSDRRDPARSAHISSEKRFLNNFNSSREADDEEGAADSAVVENLHRSVLGPPRRPRFTSKRGLPQSKNSQTTAKGGDKRSDLPEIPNVEPRLVEMIMNDMLDRSPGVDWDDIAGLHFAKRCVMEAVVWPMKRPDIFTGLRGPPKGLLLFGPPGTGKTLIGRAIASKSGARFFNISASSLMSKWVGEGEKMVRALFSVARVFQPSVVFIDEIDSLLTQRTESDQESSRRVKTEFLVQMDGAGTSQDDRVLVVGATNRPAELDEAARRRLVKRLYIPLPDADARGFLISRLLKQQSHEIDKSRIDIVVKLTAGYSGSDMYALCAEAALGPVRELGDAIGTVDAGNVRPISLADFQSASRMVRASVSEGDLGGYLEWNETYGSFPSDEVTP